jgi:ABC-type polysaccharide/polyol phosphate export permease
MAGVIKTARSELLQSYATNWLQFILSIGVCLLVLVIGWWYFRYEERQSVDSF